MTLYLEMKSEFKTFRSIGAQYQGRGKMTSGGEGRGGGGGSGAADRNIVGNGDTRNTRLDGIHEGLGTLTSGRRS